MKYLFTKRTYAKKQTSNLEQTDSMARVLKSINIEKEE